MKPLQRLCVVSLKLFIATAVNASELPDAKSDSIRVKYYFNPIVVTATKIAYAQRDLVASISVIGETRIHQEPTSAVFEVVKNQVPGLYVTEWGVMGFGAAGQSAGKISVRGMGGGANTHILILRNGRPDFMGLMGCTIADEFSTDGVERIEIVRGPASFLYGTNATGGVITIIPKKCTEPGFETFIRGSYGAFDSRKLFAGHGGKIGDFDYYLTAASRRTDGHREDANSHYEAEHYTAHLGYAIGKKTTLEFNGSLANIDLFDPGLLSNPRKNDWYDICRYGGDLTLVHQGRFGDSHIKLHGNFGRHKIFDGWRSNDQLLGLMAYHNIKPWSGNTTTVGFDIKNYGGDAVDASSDYGSLYITEYAPYLHTQQLMLQRFIVSAGLRVEHHELYGKEILPKAGLVFHPIASSSIRLSLAKGFRSPSIRELYFWMPANDKLTPDRLWNYEIGLMQDVGRRVHLELALFRADGSNLIQFSGPPPKWINSGKYTHTGYEVIINCLPVEAMEIGASWTKLDLSEDVYNMPGKKLTAYVHYNFWRFGFSVNFICVSDLLGADFSGPSPLPVLHPMDDYMVLHLTARIQVIHHLGLKVSVKNALDGTYQAMYGYPMPGRTVFFDVGYDF